MSGDSKLNRPEYEKLLKPLGKELVALSRWIGETKSRVVIIFEGRDTAGKGGSIDMFARVLNPRQCRVVALPTPTDREKSEWYFQRYIQHLPAAGEIVLFDRSWYNRAGVEKVMGYSDEPQVEAFLKATPEFERHLVDDGIMLFKYWLCCDQSVQELRFSNRLNNPMKRWKLSPIDREARVRYDDYTAAREAMLKATHTDFAPWTLIEFNDQQVGRLTLLRDFLDRVPDTQLPYPEMDWPPLENEASKELYGALQPITPFGLPEEIEQRDMIHSWD
jgi:polyphosphate kinase 2